MGTHLVHIVDLTFLSEAGQLLNCDLGYNQIKQLTLSSLKNCLKLQFLNLEGNELNSLELYPLKHCKSLNYLNLATNNLATIDLSPLKESYSLISITVDPYVDILWQADPIKREELPPRLQQAIFHG